LIVALLDAGLQMTVPAARAGAGIEAVVGVVEIGVVALLGLLRHSVAARRRHAVIRAGVVVDGVAVVAALTGPEVAVAAARDHAAFDAVVGVVVVPVVALLASLPDVVAAAGPDTGAFETGQTLVTGAAHALAILAAGHAVAIAIARLTITIAITRLAIAIAIAIAIASTCLDLIGVDTETVDADLVADAQVPTDAGRRAILTGDRIVDAGYTCDERQGDRCDQGPRTPMRVLHGSIVQKLRNARINHFGHLLGVVS
jgi:hypothetical protein